MTLSQFESLELAVGKGENNFSMSRGSFVYKQKFSWKRQLSFTGKSGTDAKKFTLSYEDKKTHLKYEIDVAQDEKGAISVKCRTPENADVNRWWISFPADADERIYGCGETYSEFNLKGEKIRIWVAEHQNAKRITKKIILEKLTGKHPNKIGKFSSYESYYVQPTFVSSKKFYIHVNANKFSEFDFTNPAKTTLYLQDNPEFVCENASSFTELSKKLADRLGRQRKLPDWIYDGAILAIQQGNEVIDKKLEKAEKAGVKVVGVWSQDWCGCRRTGFGYQVMWNWQSDEEQYPALKAKIAEWNKKGVRLLGYINPFIALEKNLYQEAKEKGYCVKDKEGNDYLVTITTFPAAMVDFTNPEAYNWYKNIIKENMIGIGLSGWMADFGEYLPIDSVLYSGEDPQALHNQWPAIWAKMNKEAIEECGKQDEIFFFTRAGHTGTIAASAMMWTGDQHVDWSLDDGLPSVIPATLSLGMSGYAITHSDVGGYTTIMQMNRSKELLMRWEEMNVFSPLFRSHEGNQPVKNAQFDDDEELLAQLKKCVDMHIALKPYLKELESEAITNGTPVMRPLFYHYDEEKAYDEKTEYLLGQDVLVAPIYVEGGKNSNGKPGRKVYLPNDNWIHVFSGKEYTGGTYDIDSTMGQPPVFVKKGSKWQDLLKGLNK
ncbi:MAG: alpha-glucosidase [Treponemataceae bacterium]|nr:alpha-glucosidase [Treponemataceae bacterium]